ncbi:MAG: ATP-binding protein [Pseudomonadota bacterium]
MEKDCQEKLYLRELETLLKFCALINSSLNIEGVLDNAMRWAEEFINAEASSIYEIDEEKNELFIRIARGEKKEPVKGLTLKVGEGIAGFVFQNGQPLVIQDVRKDKRFNDKFDKITGYKTRSMICVPLILRGTAVGVIQVLNKKSREPFSNADLQLLVAMAQQIVVAMENAKLYQRLETNFAMTSEELKTTQDRLIRSERLAAVGNLVQGVAHEIRNPVMTIGGFAQRIKNDGVTGTKIEKYIDIILDESARLEKLVKQVREFAEVQSAVLNPDFIGPVISQIIKEFDSSAKNQGVTFLAETAAGDLMIQMDVPQLLIALSNIVENALDSMPQGGALSLRAKRKDDRFVIAVSDTGCGIPEEQLEAVYDPFVTSKTRGAGLGLTMVYKIIMNHHGDIEITSAVNKGTTVTITLPLYSGPTKE